MTHFLPAFFLPFFGFGFVMYFLPSIIALARSKRDITAIVLLNFFLGWTMIGWVVALVWAVKTDVPDGGAVSFFGSRSAGCRRARSAWLSCFDRMSFGLYSLLAAEGAAGAGCGYSFAGRCCRRTRRSFLPCRRPSTGAIRIS